MRSKLWSMMISLVMTGCGSAEPETEAEPEVAAEAEPAEEPVEEEPAEDIFSTQVEG